MSVVARLRAWISRHPDGAVAIAFALAATLPLLWTAPGRVSADTKSYLTLDPDRLLSRATTMWDPLTGAGTVPHQNIGYLFPLGPYYWVMERLAVPDWITQRSIWALLVFAAAYGAYRLARWLGWSVAGAVVVGVAYGFTPYLLSYLARLSVILGPWAAMPWLILLAARAARTRSWRPAAWFAVVVSLVGSVNATALVLAGLGPVLWLLTDVAAGRVRVRQALAAAARIGVLTGAVSLWWIAALRIQGTYGIPILRYTETYQTVAGASTPAEIVRGLGYWFFYGGDRLDPWVGPSTPYVDAPIVIGLGFALAVVSLLGLLTAFSGRAVALVWLLVGMTVSVGAAPLGGSSLYGSLFEWWATNSTAGMALRSTPRAAPLVVLALAFGLGAATEWVRQRVPTRSGRAVPGWIVPAIAVALIAAQLLPWFTGAVLTPSLLRDEQLPEHQRSLAAWLDDTVDDPDDPGGRVYEMPAADFAYYRWGGTVDPVLPGIIDRPYLARELVPQGGMATIDLLDALERRIPEGWFEPEALRAFAELFAVETLVLRNDLEHERLRLARPGQLWTDVSGALGDPDHAGPLVADTPVIPVLDEVTLAHPEAADEFPVVAAFEIGDGDAVRVVPAASPVIVAGSGDGLVDLAAAGLLDPARPILYAATLDALAADDGVSDDELARIVGDSPWWVFTDTNRREARHWSGVSSNRGALEPDGEIRLDDDPADARLDVFPEVVDQQTHAVHVADVADVRASYYGNRIAFTPEDAPWFAIDGDPTTAWRAGVFDAARGLVWEADLVHPATATELTILQPTTGVTSRHITEVEITLAGEDGSTTVRTTLDDRSRSVPGQVVKLPGVAFDALRIEVLADNLGPLANYAAQPGVGLAEVVIAGVVDDRVTDVPGLADFPAVDAGDVTGDHLTYVLTRQRIDPATSNRTSPEPAMSRRITVPSERTFTLRGEARVAADAGEETLAAVLGDEGAAVADRRLPGSVAARGQSAFDGDRTTAWQTPFGDPTGATVTVPAAWRTTPATALTVSWFDDGRHSPPSALRLSRADGTIETVEVPATAATDGVATATLPLAAGAPVVAVGIAAVSPVTSPEYFSGVDQVLPVGIVDVSLGGDRDDEADHPAAAATLDEACREDLLTLDGRPLAVRVLGTRDEAVARRELAVEACAPVTLTAGEHRLDVVRGAITGIDIDRLVLDAPSTADADPGGTASPADAPDVSSRAGGPSRIDITVGPTDDVTWLVLRQSWNPGWTATVDGVELVGPVLIDGYANGWLLPPSSADRTVTLDWAPQRSVTVALWLSLAAAIGVLVLAVAGRRQRVPLTGHPDGGAPGSPVRSPVAVAVVVGLALVVVAGPVVAAGSLLVAVVARRRRELAAAVVAAAMAVVAAGIVGIEWRRDLPADPQWPSEFAWSVPLVWLAVGAVVTTGVLTAADGARRRRTPGTPHL